MAWRADAEIVQPNSQTLGDSFYGTPDYKVGNGISGELTSIQTQYFYDSSSTFSNVGVQFLQYSDAGYSSLVGDCAFIAPSYAAGTGTHTDDMSFYAPDTSGVGCTFSSANYVEIAFPTNASGTIHISWYGSVNLPSGWTIVSNPYTTIQAPFLITNGLAGGPGGINWAAINQSPPIPYGAISFATTSAGLFSAFSTTTIAAQCSTGNVVSDALCAAGAFLFIPNPTVLQNYTDLPAIMQSKFPLSYVAALQQDWSAISATSSTSSMITVGINFHDVDPSASSSFGSILPNVTVLSKATIETYIPDSMWQFFQFLIAIGIWIAFATDVFFFVKNKWFSPVH